MQVWRQVSHPVRSSFPLLFIRSHSVKREKERERGEMEEEDMVRSRKPLSLSLSLSGLARMADGGGMAHVCVSV